MILYNVALGLSLLIALLFSILVILTGKGDAMSGGGSVRTTFKGKAGFDDIMSRWTLGLGIAFLLMMIVVDTISNRVLPH